MKKIVKYFDNLIENNFFVLSVFLILTGIIRNYLELVFYDETIEKLSGFSLKLPGLLDTISYVFLMVIAEGYIINLLLKGGKRELRFLIQKGSQLLFGLFVLIPTLNNIFNYHFLYLPIFYRLSNIHPLLVQHYGPVGINVAFLIVLFLFPLWLKKVYKCSLLESFRAVLIVYGSHYIITYQVWLSFSFGAYFAIYNPFFNSIYSINMYTIGFILITLFIYPFFMGDYPKNKKEFFQVSFIYFLLWITMFYLFFFNPSL